MTRHRTYSEKKSYKTPIVGVCVRKNEIKKLLKQQEPPKIKELKEANRKAQTTLYFFSITDVNFKEKKIDGVYFNERKMMWEKKFFPYPNIIYKRNFLTKRFQDQLKKQKVKSLNYLKGFDKWEVYKHLSNDEALNGYLPETIIYNSPDDLKKMFDTSEKIYLKACKGRQGREVARITKLQEDTYEFSFFKNKLYIKKIKKLDNLILEINRFFGTKKFIIQQAINLISVDNKIVDLRAEVQRNGKGEINIIAVPVRVSQENSPITTHAEIYAFECFFKNKMNYSEANITQLKEQLNKLLYSAYESIERAYGLIGELGIDIGLDQDGRLWYIECNSQSKKVSFIKAYDKKTINESFVNLLEYAKYRYKKGI